MTTDTTTTIRRLRCGGIDRPHLLTADMLINPRPTTHGTAGLEADGPCPVCGMGWQRGPFGALGPADRAGAYAWVAVKGTRMPTVRCTDRCWSATSVDCKCQCGGEYHGLGQR